MSVPNYYQVQPDCYARFDWGGPSLEGEFFNYKEYGRDIDPEWGYIRPFDRTIGQQLIDNLQATHRIDLLTFASQGDPITYDVFVTHKDLQTAHQILVGSFDPINESELTTEREHIDSCRIGLIRRQYTVGSNLKGSKESLDNLSTEFLKWVTPFYMPLCYEQKWLTKRRNGLLRFDALIAVAVFAYIHYGW